MSIRVYADTSVFGGVFDPEFENPSFKFFEQVRAGRFQLVISDTTQAEILPAPEAVRKLWDEFFPLAEYVNVTPMAVALQEAYLRAGIVTPKWEADALHVAVATAQRCRVIVSWNFQHIVHFDKIPLYNGVNLINGYDTLSINTPSEVISYEE
ncbi:MAG: type II toxin-antitoxin system VapC family toxin [Terrimicrobiaceae bacterium]